jgi:hypothetical protein
MSRHPRCDYLRAEANSKNWSEVFVLYCRKAAMEDLQMAQQMSALCGRLVAVSCERAEFILELETIGNIYAQKTAEYLREVQQRDDQKVMQMRIMAAELELNARNNDLFIQKLKGLMDF